MPLNDSELLDILKDQGISDVFHIIRTEHVARSRASLNKIEIHTKDHTVLSLLEKSTLSSSAPLENTIYEFFSNKNGTVPTVFYNKYDRLGHEGILLMEDLSPTHSNIADWEVPIEPNKLVEIIELISTFHAFSWERNDKEIFIPKHMESTEEYLNHINYLERDYLHFRKHQPYNFREEQFDIYEKSLVFLRENAQKHLERFSRNQNVTLIHGDLNVCNILYPLNSDLRPYLVDLEAVKAGLCTEDLVMIFVHDLYHGGQETINIFQQYHRSICSKILNKYSYDEFMEDIRESIMEGIFFPLKLFVHQGVQDEELIWKSIHAFKVLIGDVPPDHADTVVRS